MNPFEPIIAAFGNAFTGFLTVIVTLLLALFGSGCQSSAKFTPEQQQSIASTFDSLNKAAAEAGVQATAFIKVERPGFFMENAVGISGIEAFVVASANPPANSPWSRNPTAVPADLMERWQAIAADMRDLLVRVQLLEDRTATLNP